VAQAGMEPHLNAQIDVRGEIEQMQRKKHDPHGTAIVDHVATDKTEKCQTRRFKFANVGSSGKTNNQSGDANAGGKKDALP